MAVLKSKIEWTETTWSPIRGCSMVSAGCSNCYAMRQAHRFSGKGEPYEGLTRLTSNGPVWTGEVRLVEKHLEDPLRWKRPRRIFVNSMSDLFHESIPDEWIDRIFAVMALCPQHTFQVLTKRAERMQRYLTTSIDEEGFTIRQRIGLTGLEITINEKQKDASSAVGKGCYLEQDGDLKQWPIPNVWLGVSVEDQKTADERIPWLLKTPAAVRWVSYEPALGPLQLSQQWRDYLAGWDTESEHGRHDPETGDCIDCPVPVQVETQKIDWLICGGESGPGARPMHPDWARSVRDQCVDAGVPFFFKQWGEWAPASAIDHLQKLPFKIEHTHMNVAGVCQPVESNLIVNKVGKKRAGRLLDGKEWSQYPTGEEQWQS